MGDLRLSVAVGDYDRVRPLFDGRVGIDGVDPVFLKLEPEEIFFRAARNAEFDICELSLSSFTVMTAAGNCPYVGVPVFPSRSFRHNGFFIRTDRGIKGPEDLRGRKVGLPEYQLTANVWMRAMLQQDYGVAPSQIHWFRGGYETPGRIEKIALSLPADVRVDAIADDATLSDLLESGELDAVIGPRAPSCFERGSPHVGRLFPDWQAAAADWYSRRKVFPIMHLLGVRKDLAEQHPWLPATLFKAFDTAKAVAVGQLGDLAALKVTLPFLEEHVRQTRELMGDDFWSYGLAANRPALEMFLEHHHSQGLSARRLQPEDLFHPFSLDSFRI